MDEPDWVEKEWLAFENQHHEVLSPLSWLLLLRLLKQNSSSPLEASELFDVTYGLKMYIRNGERAMKELWNFIDLKLVITWSFEDYV